MADVEHLEIIQQGADVWNSWREDNPGTVPDLESAHLGGFNLEGINLERANLLNAKLVAGSLDGADLAEACLRDANLIEASLRGASLREANLKEANLGSTRLAEADLTDANLLAAHMPGVDLSLANLRGARLRGANLLHIVLSETVFSNTDLSFAGGLTTCRHFGPSCVDHRTLARSRTVPVEFWRGCGLSDWQIEAAKLSQPGLSSEDVHDIGYELIRIRADQPIQLFSPFISYSSQDDAFARRLYESLQNKGVRCWFAPEDMKIGDRIRRRIDEVIHLHDRLLLILSEHSVASPWVEKEVETAFEKERETGRSVLFPIKIDDAVDEVKAGWAADIRRSRHIGDFRRHDDDDAFQEAFYRVLRDLRAMP